MKKLLLIMIAFGICSCRKSTTSSTTTPEKSSNKSITSFQFLTSQNAGKITSDISGTILGNTITAIVPSGTVVTSMISFIVTTGVSISPDPTIPRDFSNPVTYTVTAQDGTTTSYTVTITQEVASPYPTINSTINYSTASDGTPLQINFQTPIGIANNTTRPIIVFTHGTGSNEHNDLQISQYTTELLSQGMIVANFNFYGNNNTKNNADGNHLYDQYPAVVEYIISHASTYHINTNAIILCGASGSAAMAIQTAFKKNTLGCIVECGGISAGYVDQMPSTLTNKISFAGIQTRSDQGFDIYKYSFADAQSGNSHNFNAWTENSAISLPIAVPDGDCSYCTAWSDCGLMATKNYLSTKYNTSVSMSGATDSYIKIIEGSTSHCPSLPEWHTFVLSLPKRMFNDRGITW